MKIEKIADELLTKFKINDYFYRITYVTAVYYDVSLLMEDEVLHGLVLKEGVPKLKEVLKWRHIHRLITDTKFVNAMFIVLNRCGVNVREKCSNLSGSNVAGK